MFCINYVDTGGIDMNTHFDVTHLDCKSLDDFQTGTTAAIYGGTTLIGWLIESFMMMMMMTSALTILIRSICSNRRIQILYDLIFISIHWICFNETKGHERPLTKNF